MVELPILVIPDQRLRTVAEPVATVDDDVRALLYDMLETMYKAHGLGLAAPQIGVLKRLVVIDVAQKEEGEKNAPIFMINPEITWSSDELSVYDEGCLSIPDYYEEVERPARVRVRYLDQTGAAQEIEAEGILATCVQHEIDHLNGVLFIDHVQDPYLVHETTGERISLLEVQKLTRQG